MADNETEDLRREVEMWKGIAESFYLGHKMIDEKRDWTMMRSAITAYKKAGGRWQSVTARK